ncbi:MAG TPA: MtrB/PioB family outer membrane beta-barrel protein [Casimicrobiaceae bacterium]|nr:MtrB/PioB family outer membrane beta-barrel protein [Casimicrobiaceae bacterium]
MTKKLLPALIAGLFVSAPAFAQYDSWGIIGSGTVGFMYNSTSDTKDASKLDEYRDLSNGVLSNVYVRGRNNDTWFEGYGENFGRDDQYLMLRGGVYDRFKYQIFSDSLRHNFLFNGLTPFTGSGSNVLQATFPQPNPALWNPVDIGYKRTNDGGYFEWQGLAPWYFRVDANQVKFDGTKIGSGALGTSPGNGFIDLAIPVKYNTRNITGEAGYNTGTMNLSVSYLYSKFDNDYSALFWNNPFFANNGDTTFLPPDNHYERFTAQGTFRGLPGQSTFAARYTWAQGKSDADMAQTALNNTTAPFYGPTLVNASHFTGKNTDDTFTASLASHPLMNVDTRIYYNYYKRDNDSTDVIYPAASIVNCSGGPCEATLLHYTKNNFGLDGYWRFARNNRLGAGWDYEKLTHNREDYDNIKTNRFFVEWKNTALETLSARVKYTYLQRRSDFLLGDSGVDANDPEFLARFASAFDSSDLDRNQIKVTADWSPLPLLDFSLEYNWTDNNYKNITLGRTSDKRDSIYLSGGYGDVNSMRFTAFGDWEQIKYDSSHRQVNAGTCPTTSGGVTATNCFDVTTPPNSIAYNWGALNKDRNWVIGAGLDWRAMDRLLIKGSILYYETDGSADISSQNNFGNPLPINAYDDTKRTSVNVKGIYSYDKNWDFTLGYAYERWRYNDAGYNGYQYTIPFPGVTTNTSQSYLNGFNAFNNYETNIVYVLANYHFDTLKH